MSAAHDSTEAVLAVNSPGHGPPWPRRQNDTDRCGHGDDGGERVGGSVRVQTVAKQYKAPDGGWGWMVVLGSFVGHFFLEGVCRSMGIIFVALLQRYGGSATATALPMSLYNTLRMVLGRPVIHTCMSKEACDPDSCDGKRNLAR